MTGLFGKMAPILSELAWSIRLSGQPASRSRCGKSEFDMVA
jgi:hypothetical protein